MTAAVQGRVDWLREDERHRQGVSLLDPTLLCVGSILPFHHSSENVYSTAVHDVTLLYKEKENVQEF
jgi:hypothetical protein